MRDRLEALRRAVAEERLAAASLLDRQGWQEGSTRAAIESLIERFDDDRRGLEKRRRHRVRWLSRLAQLRTDSSDVIRRRDDAERARATAARQAEDAANAQRVAAEVFTARVAQLFPGETEITLERLEAATAAVATKQDKAQVEFDEASRAVAEAKLRSAALQQAEESLKVAAVQALTARNAAEKALAALAPRWLALGWTDEDMVPTTIEAAASDLNRAKKHFASAAASLGRLRAGREAWARQAAHKTDFERLSAQADLAPNSTRDEIRAAVAQRLNALEAEVQATTEAKAIASGVSAQIADAVSKFNSDYIEPLDKLTKQINRAILCDERISIEYTIGKKRITQSAGLKGQLPPKVRVDPALIHSEGQMAALAVSTLCGASLTYPWSRWRALVFDDPLQHNDAIHASAFADLIANLVQAKDYQVLVSTHDLAQAEFLRRKFDARRLPCAMLNLLGLSEAGVEWEFMPPRGFQADSIAASA